MMGRRSDYKKAGGLADWDLDAGCRRIVGQSTPGRRRLRKRLKRIARKKLNRGDDGWVDKSCVTDAEPCANNGESRNRAETCVLARVIEMWKKECEEDQDG